MKRFVQSPPPAVVWSLLVVATGLTFAAGEYTIPAGEYTIRAGERTITAAGAIAAPGQALIAGVLLLAFAKAALVILDFMELRHAPALWRNVVFGWLTLVVAGILLAYLK